MNENQWLTSTDPQAMYAFIKDRVTERQQRFFVEACRSLCEIGYADPIVKSAFNSWCTGLLHRGPTLKVRADLLREIIGNPFRYSSLCGVTEGISTLDECIAPACVNCKAILAWNNSTIPNLIHAMMNEECDKCRGKGGAYEYPRDDPLNQLMHGDHWYDCRKCDGKVAVPRAEPQWDMMEAIHDALIDAGCTEAAILDHLRGTEPCPGCMKLPEEKNHPIGMIFVGWGHGWQPCVDCNGAGKRPVQHIRGCWVIELLAGGMKAPAKRT